MQNHKFSPDVLPHSGAARFLAACSHKQPDATPIWFMRQAGRCLAGYRELRKKYDIVTMAKTPELCTQITLMPIQTFGVDAAILYAPFAPCKISRPCALRIQKRALPM